METLTSFISLIIFIVFIVVIIRWIRSVRYMKQGGMDNLKTHGIKPAKPSGRKSPKISIPKESKQPNDVAALLEIFGSETFDLSGELPFSGEWRSEPASNKQLKYLSKLTAGLEISVPKSLTGGQASDAIGLFVKPGEREITMLRFFKVPHPKKFTQTKARLTLHQIFYDPANVEKWANRPATTRQKDQIRFFGGKVKRGLKLTAAEKIIKELVEADEDRSEQWGVLVSTYESFVDPEIRDYIKKFSLMQFYDVIADMESAGQSFSQIMRELDNYDLYDALIKKYPKLEK